MQKPCAELFITLGEMTPDFNNNSKRLQGKPDYDAVWFYTTQLTAPAIKWLSIYVVINETIVAKFIFTT